MKTMQSIQVDFNNAMIQASNVDTCADDLKQISRQLQNALNELSGGWKGEAASIYIEKGEQLVLKINQTSKDLQKVSGSISKSAKIFYEAEKTALEVIKTDSV